MSFQADPFLSQTISLFALLRCQVHIQDSKVIHYEHRSDPSTASHMHAVRHAQCYTLRTPSSTTVPWPGDYIELDVPPNLGEDHVLALQPITDTPVPKHTKTTSIWPEPQILEAVSAKVRLANSNLNSSVATNTSVRSYLQRRRHLLPPPCLSPVCLSL